MTYQQIISEFGKIEMTFFNVCKNQVMYVNSEKGIRISATIDYRDDMNLHHTVSELMQLENAYFESTIS